MSTSEPYPAHGNSSNTLCNDEVRCEKIPTPHFGGVDLRRTKMSAWSHLRITAWQRSIARLHIALNGPAGRRVVKQCAF